MFQGFILRGIPSGIHAGLHFNSHGEKGPGRMAIVKDGGKGPNTKIFVNRADRIPVRIPVVFTFAEGKIRGHSDNISESGLLAVFDKPLEVWLTGRLSILVPEHPIFVDTRIARVEGRTVAMSFRNMGPRDRQIIQALLTKATEEGAEAV